MTALRMAPSPFTPPGAGAPTTASDKELVLAAQRDDRAAFQQLYERYAPVVHGVALAHAARSDCDDVVQDVFIRAWRKLASLRDTACLGAWLCRIARSRASDQRRRSRRGEQLKLRLVAEAEPVEQEASDPGAGEQAAAILAVLRSLPEAYRETLVLRLVEGLTGPEIAKRTGLTEGSVRVNLCRGMKLLREQLSQELES